MLCAKNLQLRHDVLRAQAELQSAEAHQIDHNDEGAADRPPEPPNSVPHDGLGGWATPRAGDRATRLTPDRLAAGDDGTAMDLADALAHHVRKPVTASTLAGPDVEAMGPDAEPSSVNLPPTSRSLSPVANDADMEAAMLATRSQDLPSAGLNFSLPALDEVLPGEDQKLRATFQPVETDAEMHAPATALPRLDVRTMTSFDKLKPLSRIIGGYRNWREQLVDLMDVIAMPTLLHIVGRQADDGSVFEFGADAYKTRALGRLYDARLYTLVNAAYDGPAADAARQAARKYNPKSGHAFVEHLDFVRGRPTQARLLALEMKVYDLRLDRAGNVQRYINAARALRTTLISYRVSPNDPIVLTRLYHQWAAFYQRLTQPSARHMSIHRALRQIAKITTTTDFDTFATRYEKFELTAHEQIGTEVTQSEQTAAAAERDTCYHEQIGTEVTQSEQTAAAAECDTCYHEQGEPLHPRLGPTPRQVRAPADGSRCASEPLHPRLGPTPRQVRAPETKPSATMLEAERGERFISDSR